MYDALHWLFQFDSISSAKHELIRSTGRTTHFVLVSRSSTTSTRTRNLFTSDTALLMPSHMPFPSRLETEESRYRHFRNLQGTPKMSPQSLSFRIFNLASVQPFVFCSLLVVRLFSLQLPGDPPPPYRQSYHRQPIEKTNKLTSSEIPTLKFPRNCMQVQTWPQIKSISTLGSLKFLSKFQSQIRRFVQVFVFYILIFGQFQFSWKCSPKALRKNDTNHRLLQNIHEKSIHFLNDMLSNLRGWSEAKAYAGRRSRKIL